MSDVKDQLKAADLSLRRARALPSSTDDKQYLISHHQAEVDNLTQQIQSMSSQVRTSQKKDIEKDTLRKIKKEEREKISDGKKAYFLKDCEYPAYQSTPLILMTTTLQPKSVNASKRLRKTPYVLKGVTKQSRNLKNANVSVMKARRRSLCHGPETVDAIVLVLNGEEDSFVVSNGIFIVIALLIASVTCISANCQMCKSKRDT